MAGAGMIGVEIPMHIFQSPMVGTMLGAAIEAIFMSIPMGLIDLAVNGPVLAVVTGVLVIWLVFVRERRRDGGRDQHSGGEQSFYRGHRNSFPR